MAVTISYDETRTSAPPSQFNLAYAVTAATDIPLEIFLHDALSPGTFLRVAQVGDFGFPTTPDPLNFAFYRASTAALTFTEYSDAKDAQGGVRADIVTLAGSYQAGVDAWDGTESLLVV